jgi:predicted PurR-regulated permease PerM
MARFVSFLILVAILVITSIIFFQVMAGFFVPLFMAALLGVVAQPLYLWMLDRCRGYRHLAAGITTTIVTFIVLLPLAFVITTATLEGLSIIDELQLANVRERLNTLRHDFGLEIPREQDVRHIEAALHAWREKQRAGEPFNAPNWQVDNLIERVHKLQEWVAEHGADAGVTADANELEAQLQQLEELPAGSVERDEALQLAEAEFRKFKRDLLGGTYRAWLTEWANPNDEQLDQLRNALRTSSAPVLSAGRDTLVFLTKVGFGTLIMIVSLFFLLAEGSAMLEAVIKVSPLEEQHVRELASEFDRACRAIVSATLFSAVAQGLLAGLGFYLFGLRSSVALLTLLTMVLALVPFTGAAAVWVPVSLYLYFFAGDAKAAIGLAIYGAVIVSTSDNIIKPLVLHGQSRLHPLLALLSVLGGIQALGPIGIVVGPMVVVFLLTLLRIIHRELMSMDRSSWMFWRGYPMAGAPASGAAASPESLVVPAPAAAAADASAVAESSSSPRGNGHAAKPDAPQKAKPAGKGSGK